MAINTKNVETVGQIRPRCPRCLLWPALCICPELVFLNNRVRLTLLVQWSEYWRPSNTGRLAQLCLSQCETWVRGKPDAATTAPLSLQADETRLLLFPGPGVDVLSSEGLITQRPIRLFIPDGTWREAGKIVRRTPFLRSMRRLQLPPGLLTHYTLRKSPRAGGVSTLEAIAAAFEILGEPEIGLGLRGVFSKFVERLLSIRPTVRQHKMDDLGQRSSAVDL